MDDKPRILIATGNTGKVRELRELFTPVPATFLGLNDLEIVHEVDETGHTFAENAALKAAGYARQSGTFALADDSGLEIAALGGRPGVHSARFAGAGAGYAEKMALLIEELDANGAADRSARFVCAMAFADGDGNVLASAEGECTGSIAFAPSGDNGFGYDPIFIPDGFQETFGQLPDEVKRGMSHRAHAAAKIMRYLLDFTGVLT